MKGDSSIFAIVNPSVCSSDDDASPIKQRPGGEPVYRDALDWLKSIMNQRILPYRYVEHAGSAAFHATLPFGILPWKYSSTPLWMEGVL